MKYRPEIDGLRALAVIPVILFHVGYTAFSGGYVGVDIFFVISGYLITSIIIGDLEKGQFSIARFYERRARRILPALFVVLVVTSVMAWFVLAQRDFLEYGRSVAAVSAFASNILFISESNYFATAAELKPLLHTWSLAVEEQFYIFFPLLLMVLWRFGWRVVLVVVLIVFAISFGLAYLGVRKMPTAAFFMLPTRAWELMIGSLCAFWLHRARPLADGRLADLLGLVGIAMIVVSVALYTPQTPFPSTYALLPCGGAALIILFAHPTGWAGRLLSHRVPLGIGLISYSAYLWHQPLIVFWRYTTFEMSETDRVVILGLSMGLAYLSWRFIEAPFRDGRFLSRARIFRLSGAALAGLFVFGIGVSLADGVPGRGVQLSPVALLDYDADNRTLQDRTWDRLRERSADPGYEVIANDFDLTPWFDPADTRAKLLVVGNSFSKDAWNLLTDSRAITDAFQIARYGSQIKNLPASKQFFASPNFRDSDVIVLASRYSAADNRVIEALVDEILRRGKKVAILDSTFEFPEFRGGLMTQADRLIDQDYNAGMRDGAEIARKSEMAIFALFEKGRRIPFPEIARMAATDNPYLVVLDRMDIVCPVDLQRCHAMDDRLTKYFYDYGHYTSAGARFFANLADQTGWLDPIVNWAHNLQQG
jgi:peptidoglycan/LPS O-acetylase OafA/YrhL